MTEKDRGKVAVIPTHDPGKVKADSVGSMFYKLTKAQYGGSYLKGFTALCFVCEKCGFVAFFGSAP